MTIKITGVQTLSQKSTLGPTTLFRNIDAMALKVYLRASPGLASLPRAMFQVGFQILDASSHVAIWNRSVLAFFESGNNFSVVLGDRSDSGSYSHPNDFNVPDSFWDSGGAVPGTGGYVSGKGLFGFRATVQAFQIRRLGPSDYQNWGKSPETDVLVPLDAFDVSDWFWFRFAGGAVHPEVPELAGQVVGDLLIPEFWPGEEGKTGISEDYPGDLQFKQEEWSLPVVAIPSSDFI